MGDNEENLRALRDGIDAADGELLAALEKRFALTDRVTAGKKKAGDGLPIFRPGREADILRRIFAESSLPPVLVESVWRQVIAFSLARQQQVMKIRHWGGAGVAHAARFRFGIAAEYTEAADAGEVITALVEGEADIGMLPHWRDGNWGGWIGLPAEMADGASGRRAYIAALTPLAATPHLAETALLTASLPDPSSADITLVAAASEALGVEEIKGYHPSLPGLLGIIQKA